MSTGRARILVGLAAAAAAAVVVTGALLQGGDDSEPAAATVEERPPPPLELGLVARSGEEVDALREAETLVDDGERAAARARFEQVLEESPRSVEAAVGAAIASWPNGTVSELQALAAEHPESGVVQLHLGLALLASGDEAGARTAWEAALAGDPDTPAALRAEDLLNPQYAPATRRSWRR